MSSTLLIDGNAIGHANHHATKLTVGALQVQAIFGTLWSVKSLMQKYSGWTPLILWDGHCQWRRDIYPQYKENRVAKNDLDRLDKEAYKAQIPILKKALQLLGVPQILVTNGEADDLAGLMSKRLSDAGNSVVLITGDQDWLQLVNKNVIWFDPIRDNTVGMGNFFEFTGYKTTAQFLQGKVLQGDTSDNISGVGGIGKDGAPEFIAEFQSVENFWAMCEAGTFQPKKLVHQRMNWQSSHFSKSEWAAKWTADDDKSGYAKHIKSWTGQCRRIYERNMKLMNLLAVPAPRKQDVVVIPATPNKDAFVKLCEKLAFASILRELDSFVSVFELNLEGK